MVLQSQMVFFCVMAFSTAELPPRNLYRDCCINQQTAIITGMTQDSGLRTQINRHSVPYHEPMARALRLHIDLWLQICDWRSISHRFAHEPSYAPQELGKMDRRWARRQEGVKWLDS